MNTGIKVLSLREAGFHVLGNPSDELIQKMNDLRKDFPNLCGYAIVYNDPVRPMYLAGLLHYVLDESTDCEATEPRLYKKWSTVQRTFNRLQGWFASHRALSTNLFRVAFWVHPEANFRQNPKYMAFRRQVDGCPRQ